MQAQFAPVQAPIIPQKGYGPILVVDDEKDVRDVIAEILTDEGYRVQTASNGAEAIQMVARSYPSLILLDMRMPVIDGWSVSQTLRSAGLDVPIVVMTAAQSAERWAKEVRAKSFLAKPFEVKDLLSTVSGIIRSA